ncbi:MAG: transcriptional regulator, partial [Candidatus Limnocylindria bacterium]
EDAAMAQRDPSVILWWLRHRVDRDAAPEQQVAIELDMRVPGGERTWLLVARDTEPNLCLEDPLLGEERYLYVEADPAALLPVAQGTRSWAEAIADGSVSVFGSPALVGELNSWFLAPEPARTQVRPAV